MTGSANDEREAGLVVLLLLGGQVLHLVLDDTLAAVHYVADKRGVEERHRR